MKRLLCILLAMAMLCGMGFAEDAQEAEEEAMRLACAHQFQLSTGLLPEHEWCVRDLEEPENAAVSATCIYCDAEGVVFKDKALIEPDSCNAAVCTHRLYWLPDFNRTEWKKVNDKLHQRIEYGVGICVDCGTFGTLFRELEHGEHQMVASEGFHIEGQYIHVVWEECLLCGVIDGALVPCVSYEDGICDRTK